MSGDDERETTQASVKTYVPAYQKEAWQRHAERLGMSQSEFVRTMVQAGRRDIDVQGAEDDDGTTASAEHDAPDLESQVVDVLAADGHCSWDELVTRLTDDVETRLDDALQSLQSADRVRYSGREGGYALVEETHGE